MAWLGTWAKRRKITVDNTNIDSDLTHFPVPIVLGTSVGQSSQDVSDIFDEVGSSSLKIAITKTDGTTQINGEIELWDSTGEKAVIWVSKSDLTLSSSATTDLYIYFDSAAANNIQFISETDSPNTTSITGDTFTGTDGDPPDSDKWKAAVESNGTAEIQSNKLQFDITSAIGSVTVESAFKMSGDFDIQIDFDILSSTTTDLWLLGMTISTLDNNIRGSMDIRYLSGIKYNGDSSVDGTPSGATAATTDTSGKLRIVRSGSTVTMYYDDSGWTLLHTVTFTDLELRVALRSLTTTSQTFSGTLDTFVINSGPVVYAPVLDVWDTDFEAVLHMAQDPNGDVADSILDSTFNKKHGTPYGTMTTADLVAGGIGSAIEFDGTDDYIDIPTPELFHKTDDYSVFASAYSAADLMVVTAAGLTGDTWGFRLQHDVNYAVANAALVTMDYTDPPNDQWNAWNANRTGSAFEAWVNNGTKATDTQSGSLRGLSGDYVAKTILGAYWNSGAAGTFVAGKIGEVRVSSVVRSDAWVKASTYAIDDDLIVFAATETLSADPVLPAAEMTMSASLTIQVGVPIPTAEMTMAASQMDPAVLFTAQMTAAEMTMSASQDSPAVLFTAQIPTAEMTMSAKVGVVESVEMTAAEMTMSAIIDGVLLRLSIPTAEMTMSASLANVVTFDHALADVYYIFTLTGGADGETDLTIPMASFQTRMRSGDPTFLSVVIPDGDYAAAINLRPNGTLKVDMAYKLDGVFIQRETIVEADFDSIRTDEGVESGPITLSGHKTETYPGAAITLTASTYRSTINGKIRHRLAEPNINLKPGDMVTIGSDTFVADLITYFMSVNAQTMEVAEA